jgi:hypothetical protein
MVKTLWLVFFSTITVNLCLISANTLKKGLHFHSHEVNFEDRTSLILNNGNPYTLKQKDIFSLEMDVWIRAELDKFGYLFRIISNSNENFDLITNNHDEYFFVINKNNFQKRELKFENQKLNVKIVINKANNEITVNLNGDIMMYTYDLSKTTSLSEFRQMRYYAICIL